MASMNNWLGFSLSPSQNEHGDTPGNQCYDLSSDSATPSLSLPPPFGILEAFHRNNQPQDWNVKVADGINYKTNSDLSMIMVGSCTGQSQEPKLENFLGDHSEDHKMGGAAYGAADYIFQTCSSGARTNNSSSIGLSMIKSWLRNQPAPAPEQRTPTQPSDQIIKNGSGANGGTLTLSMRSGAGEETPSPDDPKDKQQAEQEQTKTATESGSVATEAVPRKSIDTFGQRTSIYRGVTRHRWTGRYEAHLWDNSCRREGQTRKGRQVYLGGYDKEEKAARAYDLAALKYWGPTTTTNFPISDYEKESEEMKHMTRQEFVASLRRRSSGFSRGASIYRGVTRHHQHGRWQARIGRVAGNKDLYLGTFSTQEEAAEAYDIAAIKFRGTSAVTNFEISRYDVKSILESSTLPIGGAARRLKDAGQADEMTGKMSMSDDGNGNVGDGGMANYGFGNGNGYGYGYGYGWSTSIAYQQQQQAALLRMHPYAQPHHQKLWCKEEVEQDVELGGGSSNNSTTHNFFHQQPHPVTVMHNNVMTMESMEHCGNGGVDHGGYGSSHAVPMGYGEDGGYESMMYSYQQLRAGGVYGHENVEENDNDNRDGGGSSVSCNNIWVPSLCRGPSTFSVWNDT